MLEAELDTDDYKNVPKNILVGCWPPRYPRLAKWGTSWTYLVWAKTTWNALGSPGMSWNHLEPPKARWNHGIDSARNWLNQQEIHRKNCVQYHCPIKYSIRNSYCHKGTPFSQMFAGETTWNGMNPVASWHKKDTHRGILSVQYHY